MTPENRQLIIDGARLMLEGLGVDLDDHNFSKTPERMAKVYEELFTPKETEWPVFDEDYTNLVMLRNFEFYTMCPHHFLPVKLKAHVAYLPKGKVVGASKLGRMLLEVNRAPMTQEKLTDLAVGSVVELTDGQNDGVAVMLIGEHGCFRVRGLRTCADMVTTRYTGQFLTDELRRQEFLAVTRV